MPLGTREKKMNWADQCDAHDTEGWYQARKDEVHAFQRAYNMTPRSDSRLTELYAHGKTRLSAREVARELMATHYIYKVTLYGESIEQYMRAVAQRIRDRYQISWSATWEVTRKFAPNALKLIMLLATGTRIPERLPDDLRD